MRIRDDEREDELSINITPMVDVVFQLLIFFMVATTFLDPERQIDVDLPKAESGAVADKLPDELIINVLRDGSLRLFDRAIDDAGLGAELEKAARKDHDMPVTIRGDRLAHHERIVAVMDACGVAGLRNLAVGTLDTGGG